MTETGLRRRGTMHRSRALGASAFVLLALLAAWPPVSESAEPPILASGRQDGMYWRLAKRIPGVAVKPTKGSAENLELLSQGEVRFALAQQDVVSQHFLDNPRTEVRVVGRVFFDYLHIFLRDPIQVETAGDLSRLRIWTDEEGSGTRFTASRFLDSVGVSSHGGNVLTAPPGAPPIPTGAEELTLWLDKKKVDVAMLVTTPGSPTVCRLMSTGRLRLLSLDPKTLRRLTREETTDFRRQTAIGRIPAHTYANQPAPVPTIAVPVLLLARQGESPEAARRLLTLAMAGWQDIVTDALKAVRQGASDSSCLIPEDAPPAASLSESKLVPLDGIPFETSARAWMGQLSGWLLPVLLLAGLLLAGRSFAWHLEIRNLWREDKLPFILVLLLAMSILLITVLTFLLEHGINENFSSLTESFWSITVYLFSGLEDRTPYTASGRIVAALGLLLGPAFFAVVSGWLARFFIRREKHMPQNLRDHYLLLNWNERAAEVVRELHHPVLRERNGVSVIVVLTDDDTLNVRQIRQAGSGWDAAFEDFYLSIGDPTAERALLNANAQDARTILILADDAHGDERTIRSLLMLRKIARDHGLSEMHVVAELLNPANATVLDELAKDFPGLLERISGLQVRTCLLAQAALNRGIVGFYSDLLRVSGDTNEVYTHPIPESAEGLPFREYAAQVLRSNATEPLIPVGVQRLIGGRTTLVTNPQPGTPEGILQRGDRLVLLAYQPPSPGALPHPESPAIAPTQAAAG